jgi:chromate transporter
LSARPPAIAFAEALAFWFKLGFISFGGPAGQIAIMHRELVERRRWVSERRFLHALNYCMVLPGPEAQQLATYLGWLMHGTAGGIAAGALFVLPSFFLLAVLSWGYIAFGSTPLVASLLAGVKPAVVAIVIAAVLRIASRAVKHPFHVTIAVAAFLALAVLSVPFPLVILGAGLAGVAGKWIAPRAGAGSAHAASGKDPGGPAAIGDDTPTPDHAKASIAKFAVVVAAGLALGLAPFLALVAAFGAQSPFVTMAAFFTKAALVTFGGAYAVLPYLVETAVNEGWATTVQMIDGLALGETTPGPLIMIVTFVGFLGGWAKAALGAEALVAAAWLGAAIATWFTFLPSFVFILAGGPFVEGTRGEIRLERPLAAITAAVVGVISNLAVFFGWHVLWPRATSAAPFSGGFEWMAAAIAVAALVALVRYKAGVITVIVAAAAAGLALAALR